MTRRDRDTESKPTDIANVARPVASRLHNVTAIKSVVITSADVTQKTLMRNVARMERLHGLVRSPRDATKSKIR